MAEMVQDSGFPLCLSTSKWPEILWFANEALTEILIDLSNVETYKKAKGLGNFTQIERLVKRVAVHLPGTMGTGTGQGGFLGAFLIPKWRSLPIKRDSPPQISRKLLAWASWQNSMATK